MAPKTSLVIFLAALSATASPLNVTELGKRQALAPGGTQAVFEAGFTLNDDQGNTIWSSSAPAGQSPCTIYGESFSLSGGCLPETYVFDCMTDQEVYGNCAVWENNRDGDPTDCQTADTDTYEDVLFAGSKDVCAVSFDIEGSCGTDEDLTASHEDRADIDACPYA